MERTWGPIRGFYITAYAAPCGDGVRYASYAKVCVSPPASYFEAQCLFKMFGGDDHDTESDALAWARLIAQSQLERIPSREPSKLGFAAFDEAQQVVFPLASQIRARAT